MTTQIVKNIRDFDNLNASKYSTEELYACLGYKKSLADFPINKHLAICEEIKSRYANSELKQIHTSKDAYDILQFMKWEDVEHFYVIFMKHNGVVIKTEKVSSGGITGTVVDQRIIFSMALETKKCTRIVLCHNHPSGNVNPSETDKRLTERIVQAGKILDIEVTDHIIVAGTVNNNFFSFRDEGLI